VERIHCALNISVLSPSLLRCSFFFFSLCVLRCCGTKAKQSLRLFAWCWDFFVFIHIYIYRSVTGCLSLCGKKSKAQTKRRKVELCVVPPPLPFLCRHKQAPAFISKQALAEPRGATQHSINIQLTATRWILRPFRLRYFS
jgi:hypothetical protein